MIDEKELEGLGRKLGFYPSESYGAEMNAFKAGFRKCEAMMMEKFPSEEECMIRFDSHPDTHRAGALAMYESIRRMIFGESK